MDPSYNNGLNSQTSASQGGAGQGAGAPAGAGGTPPVFSGQSVPNMPSALNAPSAPNMPSAPSALNTPSAPSALNAPSAPNMPSAPSALNTPSAPAVATPIVGGGEDIVLAPEKKTKKGLIIGLVLGVVAVVVAVVVGVIVATKNPRNGDGGIKDDVNHYMSFVMFGDENATQELTRNAVTLKTSKAYKLYYDENYSVDDKKAFFEDIYKRLNSLISDLPDESSTNMMYAGAVAQDSSDIETREETALKSRLTNQLAQVNTIIAFLNSEYIDENIMLLDYLSGMSLGDIGVKIEENCERMNQVGTPAAEQYVYVVKAMYDSMKEIVNTYLEAGCIIEGELVSSCLNSEQTEKISDLSEKNQGLMQEMMELEDSFIVDFFNTARNIYNSVNDEVVE